MRVLALMEHELFRWSVGDAMADLGHDVRYLRRVHPDRFREAVKTFRPDLLFDMGWDVPHLMPGALEMLQHLTKRHHLYHAYFAEEDWLHFERWSRPYTMRARPQFVLTRDPGCVAAYQRMGLGARPLDVGSNGRLHWPHPISPRHQCDVALVANAQLTWDIYRRESIRHLVRPVLKSDLDFRLMGRGWEKLTPELPPDRTGVLKGMLPYVETPKLYSSARICLSLQSVEDQVSSRTYDILASGGFLLTSDTPGVRARLTPGVHGEVSSSPEETLDKIRYYLAHEAKRRKIAQAGLELARDRYLYQRTLSEALRAVETHRAAWMPIGKRNLMTTVDATRRAGHGHSTDRPGAAVPKRQSGADAGRRGGARPRPVHPWPGGRRP